MQYTIAATYYTCSQATIELPEDKSWDDIKSWFVKWGRLYITYNDGIEQDFDLNSNSDGITDWKHPASIHVFNCVDNETDFDNTIDEKN